MTPRDNLEHYEATEAQDLIRLLRALRPPEREVQVPPQMDITIRTEIWKAQVRRQVVTLLSLAHRDLIQVIRQALTDNPMLEEVAPAEDEHAPAGEAHAPNLTASAADLTEAEERYDSIWQACMPNGWDAHGLLSQTSEAPDPSEHPSGFPEVLVPDVIVTKVGHDYQVFLNEEGVPRLRLSATYRRMIHEAQCGTPEAKQYLHDQLRAAVWLIRSLEQRRQTLLKVATSLVTCQRDFLDHGLAHVKPLALTAVADAIGLHASTVGRVLANKYLATAHGIVTLTSFFPSSIEPSDGETISSLTVKQRIERLIAAEDSARPLTDQRIVEILAGEHIKIARRTVTKYRCELKLPPANRRQQPGAAALGLGPAAGASRLSPDVEQRVRQALEAHTRHWLTEPPPLGASEEASGVPPEVEEAQRHRYLAWLESRQNLQSRGFPIDMLDRAIHEITRAPEVRAAYRDLQTALAHPQLRPAVLLALRAFAQAAETGSTISSSVLGSTPPSEVSEPVLPIQEVPALQETRMRDLPMICQSPKMQEVSRRIERVLQTTATVLIMGEPGTGKGLVARILHDQGPRRQGPFIAVSCADIPETGLEAELFGPFERAAGGTVFIDGIAEMSPTLQAKLLRVLQEGPVGRIESPETLPTQARIIAAATPELERLIGAGTFRRDLFYRLNVYPITLPPLRERQADLGPLTMHFLKRVSQALRKEVRGISKEAMGWLARYPWPGNVRELEEVIERAVARCQGQTVTAQDLPQALRQPSRGPGSSGEAFRLPPGGIDMCELEKELIRQSLEQAHQNKSQAAKLLGLSRAQLRARMRHYGFE